MNNRRITEKKQLSNKLNKQEKCHLMLFLGVREYIVLVGYLFKYKLIMWWIEVGVGYTGEKNRFCWGPARKMYYGSKIMEQKMFFEKNQISAFAPQKTTLNEQIFIFNWVS